MLGNGFALMAPAIAIASSLRLNGNRGFNPQRFLLSLQDTQTANVVPMPAAGAGASRASCSPPKTQRICYQGRPDRAPFLLSAGHRHSIALRQARLPCSAKDIIWGALIAGLP